MAFLVSRVVIKTYVAARWLGAGLNCASSKAGAKA